MEEGTIGTAPATQATPPPVPEASVMLELAAGRWGRKFHIAKGLRTITLSEVEAVRVAKDILRNSKPRGAFLWGDMKAKRWTNHE